MGEGPQRWRFDTANAAAWLVRVALGAILLALCAYALGVITSWPALMMQDTGDFQRVGTAAGLRMFHAQSPLLEIQPPQLDALLSSSSLLLLVVREGARLFASANVFDLRILGVVFVLGYGILLWSGGWTAARLLLAVLLAWVLFDPRYLLLSNSLFCESLLFLCVSALVLRLIRRGSPVYDLTLGGSAALAVLAAVAATTKSPYQLVPLLLLLVVVIRWWRSGQRALIGLVPLVVAAGSGILFFQFLDRPGSSQRVLWDVNNFNAVFYGIAAVSAEPGEALESLGISPQYRYLAKKTYYDIDGSIDPLLERQLRSLSRVRLAVRYAVEPAAGLMALRTAGEPLHESNRGYAAAQRRTYQRAARSWQLWHWRDSLTALAPWFWLSFAMMVPCWLVVVARQSAWIGLHDAVLFLYLNALTQVPIALLGDGLGDLGRHVIFAQFCLEVLLALVLWRVLLLFWRVVKRRATEGKRAAELPRRASA